LPRNSTFAGVRAAHEAREARKAGAPPVHQKGSPIFAMSEDIASRMAKLTMAPRGLTNVAPNTAQGFGKYLPTPVG
jgi:hypothetical protein